ncbi:MAG: TonB-dependent receptor [Bacteroidetes bacterium]|nr:MAG: TonB-dependent receptor [Bacteroidota bacterium]
MKANRFTNIILFIFLFNCACIFADSNRGVICGKIIDGKTKSGLPGATIRLEGSGYGALANKYGDFKINNVKRVKYNSIISYVGYETKKLTLDLSKSDSIFVTVELQEEIIHTSEIVVSANKRLQAVQDVPISMSVLDNKELKDRNIILVDDALRYIPGINLNGDQVSIRGSSGFAFGLGSRVAFLLDGMPFVSGDQGDIKFDAVPVFDIERIEVVKGAGSALYGSGALGGVINIITKEPKEIPESKIQLHGGFYSKPKFQQWVYSDKTSTFEGINAGFSQKFNSLGIVLSGALLKDDSYRNFDESNKWNLFSKIKYDFSAQTYLNITGSYSYDKFDAWAYWNSLDSATIPPTGTDTNERIISLKSTLFAEVRHIFNNGDFMLVRSGIYSTDFSNNPDKPEENRASKANSINSETQVSNKILHNVLLTYGINHILNNVDANIYGKKSQNIIAGYFQGEFSNIDMLVITAGGRIDYEKINGEDTNNFEFSPKIGLSFTSPWGTIFRSSVGRGFRAATVAEKYATLRYSGFSVQPNPKLTPEVSWSYEIGANQYFDIRKTHIYCDISFFENDFSNLIEPQFDFSNMGVINFKNITKARIRGIEASIKTMLFGKLGIESSLAYMDAMDLTKNEKLKYRSKYLWYNRMLLPLGFLEFQLDHRYLSIVENIDEGLILIKNSDARVPVNVLDARVIFYLSKITSLPLTFTFNIKNLLNYYYLDMVGNLAPFRNISLQVEANW